MRRWGRCKASAHPAPRRLDLLHGGAAARPAAGGLAMPAKPLPRATMVRCGKSIYQIQ